MAKILVAEDNPAMTAIIKGCLARDGYIVETADNGRDALHYLRMFKYDAAVMDVSMPHMDGIEVCRQFRQFGGSTPILMLTAMDRIEDKQTGLDAGADDYLVKPFDGRELTARVRALIRRASLAAGNVLEFGPITLDTLDKNVLVSGRPVKLSATEYNLLEVFMRYPNRLFSADALIELVWPSDATTSLDTVRSYIRMLRKKIDTGGGPSVIQTIAGAGYRLRSQR